jgi:hypothetical protein
MYMLVVFAARVAPDILVGALLGSSEGYTLGTTEGRILGGLEGSLEGDREGLRELKSFNSDGCRVGEADGGLDGTRLGSALGLKEGLSDGTSVVGDTEYQCTVTGIEGKNVVAGTCDDGGSHGATDGASDNGSGAGEGGNGPDAALSTVSVERVGLLEGSPVGGKLGFCVAGATDGAVG